MKKFIIADNQDITKAGMMFLLTCPKENTDNLLVASNKSELIHLLCVHPEAIIILDYTLFDFSGVNELITLSERFKDSVWLLFSDELSIDFLRQVLFCSHSFSIIMKDNPKEEILSALHCIERQERFICNEISNTLLSGNIQTIIHQEDKLLTITERAILKEIASGKTTKEIAAERNLSFHTVNSHRKNIFRKLEVNNIHEATKYAARAGIIDLAEYFI
ncbi:MAG: response regulator transcription factor [Bacteroidales bacterium]|nr:response regulator transcription factor [Bacteroidales bacterium]